MIRTTAAALTVAFFISCSPGLTPVQRAHAQANALSTVYPEWAACLGDRGRDFDGGLERCKKHEQRALAYTGK